MARYILKENHPTQQKLCQVENLMHELKLRFQLGPYGRLELVDSEHGVTCKIEDVDSNHDCITEFPSVFYYKLTIER